MYALSSRKQERPNRGQSIRSSAVKFSNKQKRQKSQYFGNFQINQIEIPSVSQVGKSFSSPFLFSPESNHNTTFVTKHDCSKQVNVSRYKLTNKIKKQKNLIVKPKVLIDMEQFHKIQKNLRSIITYMKRTLEILNNYVMRELPLSIKNLIGQMQNKISEVSKHGHNLASRSQTTEGTQKQFSQQLLKIQNGPHEIIQNYIQSVKLVASKLTGNLYGLQKSTIQTDNTFKQYQETLNENDSKNKKNKMCKVGKFKSFDDINDQKQ